MKATRAILALPFSAVLLLAACSDGGNESIGSTLGGAVGAVLGSEFGGGEAERRIGTAIGAIFGTRVGGKIGRQLDEAARQRARAAEAKALTSGSIGQTIRWEAPENDHGPASGAVTVNRQGRDNKGRACREYTHEVTVAGKSETVVSTACVDEDGNWSTG